MKEREKRRQTKRKRLRERGSSPALPTRQCEYRLWDRVLKPTRIAYHHRHLRILRVMHEYIYTIFSSHTLTYSHTKHTSLKTHTHTPQPEYDPSTEGHRQRGRELHNQQEVEREGKPKERRTLLEVEVLSSQQGERGRGRDRRKRAVRKGSRDLGGVGRPWVCV